MKASRMESLPASMLDGAVITRYEGERSEVDGTFHSFHGEGKAEICDGSLYKGGFFKGSMHGNGVYEFADGRVYEGNFEFDKMEGDGRISFLDGTVYNGEFHNGLRHGSGIFTCEDKKIRYEGEWKNAKRHGPGKLVQREATYQGEFAEGKREGKGTFVFPTGEKYEGQWKNDLMDGFGTMVWPSVREKYTGYWKEGKPHGMGQYFWYEPEHGESASSSLRTLMCNHYEGEFVNGKRCGKGIFFYLDGSRYDGEWLDDLKHGQGVYTFTDGRVYRGEFREDKMIGPEPELDSQAKLFGSIEVELEIKDLIPEVCPIKTRRIIRDVENVLLRYNANLRLIYLRCVGELDDHRVKGLHTMRLWQFWLLCTVCNVVDENISLAVLNRTLYQIREAHGTRGAQDEMNDPQQSILLREFIEGIVRIGYLKYAVQYPEESIAALLSRFICNNILPFETMEIPQEVVASYSMPGDEIVKAFHASSDRTIEGHIATPRTIVRQLKLCKIIGETGRLMEIQTPCEQESQVVAADNAEGESKEEVGQEKETEAIKHEEEEKEEENNKKTLCMKLTVHDSLRAILSAVIPNLGDGSQVTDYLDYEIVVQQFPVILERLARVIREDGETEQVMYSLITFLGNPISE